MHHLPNVFLDVDELSSSRAVAMGRRAVVQPHTMAACCILLLTTNRSTAGHSLFRILLSLLLAYSLVKPASGNSATNR